MTVLKDAAPSGYDLLGFTLSGDYCVTNAATGRREFRLNILKPIAGEWLIGARYFSADRDGPIPRFGDKPISVSILVKSRTKFVEKSASEIGFAEQTELVSITIPKER
jgi:hypothetical protein